MAMNTDLAVGDAIRMKYPGLGWFTGKVSGFEGAKVDVHWVEDGSSTLLTRAQALRHRVGRADEPEDEDNEEDEPEEEAPRPKRRRAAPTTKAESEEEDEEDEIEAPVRRSTREQKSVGVWVDGFFVKKANLYDLEGGERSVWDQELGNSDAAARFGASATAPPPKKKRPAAPATDGGFPGHAPPPRLLHPALVRPVGRRHGREQR